MEDEKADFSLSSPNSEVFLTMPRSVRSLILVACLGFLVSVAPAFQNPALQFNGTTDYVALTTGPATNLLNNFTVEAWALTTSGTGYHRILSNFAASPNRGYGFGHRDTRWRFTTYAVLDYDTSNSVVTTGTWTHLAVTMDSANTVRWYVNGSYLTQIPCATGARLSTSPMTLGCATNMTEFWEGAMDEIRIWNFVRSQAQIQGDFQRPLTGSEPGLVLYIPFSEGTGTTLTDTTANAVQGTLNGCTWVEGPAVSLSTRAREDWSLFP
jgi:hypothetical protein